MKPPSNDELIELVRLVKEHTDSGVLAPSSLDLHHTILLADRLQKSDAQNKIMREVVEMVCQIDSYLDIEAPFEFQELWDKAYKALKEVGELDE